LTKADQSTLGIPGRCALWAAGLLTLWAVALNNVTLPYGSYGAAVSIAIGCAAVALLLMALAWRRMPNYGRAIAALAVMLNLWTLLVAGDRIIW